MKQARTFIKVHDSIEDHPKIAPLSDAAFRLLITSWGWCRRHNTDGLMPQGLWVKRASAKVRQELLAARLVHDLGEQVEFHDYLDHQQSAAERAAKIEQRREAGRAGGQARAKRVASESSSESLSETQAEKRREEKNTLSAVAEPEFEAFWSAYPRRVGKGQARRAWDRAVKSHTVADIIAGAERLARTPGLEERFTPHPATWLNGERWLDEAPHLQAVPSDRYGSWDV